MENHGNKGTVLREYGKYRSFFQTHMREIRVDEHITLILQFAQGAYSNVRPKSGIKGTYTTYGEQLNSVGRISYDAPTGHTCSIVGLIPKI